MAAIDHKTASLQTSASSAAEPDLQGYVPEVCRVTERLCDVDEQGGDDDVMWENLSRPGTKLPADQFVEMAALELDDLPEPIRCQEVLSAIRAVSPRVVRVEVSALSPARKGAFRAAQSGPGPFRGTGFVVFIHNHFVIVSTNRHVVFDDEEARNSTIEFFVDDKKSWKSWRKFSGYGIVNAHTGLDFSLVVYWLQRTEGRMNRMYNPNDVRQHKDLGRFCFPHLVYNRSTDANNATVTICTNPISPTDPACKSGLSQGTDTGSSATTESMRNSATADNDKPSARDNPATSDAVDITDLTEDAGSIPGGNSDTINATEVTPDVSTKSPEVRTSTNTEDNVVSSSATSTRDTPKNSADQGTTTTSAAGDAAKPDSSRDLSGGGAKKFVCVIGHPEGLTKHVSFGEILEENPATREVRHTAPTRVGSSGAPILIISPCQTEAPPDSIWYHCGQLKSSLETRVARLQVNNARLFATEFNRGLVGWQMLSDLLDGIENGGKLSPRQAAQPHWTPAESKPSASGEDGVHLPTTTSSAQPGRHSTLPSLSVASRLLTWVFLSGGALLRSDFQKRLTSHRAAGSQVDHTRLTASFHTFGTLVCRLLGDEEIDAMMHPISFLTVSKALMDLHTATHAHDPCFCAALKISDCFPAMATGVGETKEQVLPDESQDGEEQGGTVKDVDARCDVSKSSHATDPHVTQSSHWPWMTSEEHRTDHQWPDACVLQATIDLLISYLSDPEVTVLRSHPVLSLLLRIATHLARVMILGQSLAAPGTERVDVRERVHSAKQTQYEGLETPGETNGGNEVSTEINSRNTDANVRCERNARIPDLEDIPTKEEGAGGKTKAQSESEGSCCISKDQCPGKKFDGETSSTRSDDTKEHALKREKHRDARAQALNPNSSTFLLAEVMAVCVDSYGSFLSIFDPWRQIALELMDRDAPADDRDNNTDQSTIDKDPTEADLTSADATEKNLQDKQASEAVIAENDDNGNYPEGEQGDFKRQPPHPSTSEIPEEHSRDALPEAGATHENKESNVDELFVHLVQHEGAVHGTPLASGGSACQCRRPVSRQVQQSMQALQEEVLSQRARAQSQTSRQSADMTREEENTKTMAAMAAIINAFSCMYKGLDDADSRQKISQRLQSCMVGPGGQTVRDVWQSLELVLLNAQRTLVLAEGAWSTMTEAKGHDFLEDNPQGTDSHDSPRPSLTKVTHAEDVVESAGNLSENQGNSDGTTVRNVVADHTNSAAQPASCKMEADEREHSHAKETTAPLQHVADGDETYKTLQGVLPRSVAEHEVFFHLCMWGHVHLREVAGEDLAPFWRLQEEVNKGSGSTKLKKKLDQTDGQTSMRGWMATVSLDALSPEDERYKECPQLFKLISQYGRTIFAVGCQQLIATHPTSVPSLDDVVRRRCELKEALARETKLKEADASGATDTEDGTAGESLPPNSSVFLQKVTSMYSNMLDFMRKPEVLEKLQRVITPFSSESSKPPLSPSSD